MIRLNKFLVGENIEIKEKGCETTNSLKVKKIQDFLTNAQKRDITKKASIPSPWQIVQQDGKEYLMRVLPEDAYCKDVYNTKNKKYSIDLVVSAIKDELKNKNIDINSSNADIVIDAHTKQYFEFNDNEFLNSISDYHNNKEKYIQQAKESIHKRLLKNK
jgi:hypothetical protein